MLFVCIVMHMQDTLETLNNNIGRLLDNGMDILIPSALLRFPFEGSSYFCKISACETRDKHNLEWSYMQNEILLLPVCILCWIKNFNFSFGHIG